MWWKIWITKHLDLGFAQTSAQLLIGVHVRLSSLLKLLLWDVWPKQADWRYRQTETTDSCSDNGFFFLSILPKIGNYCYICIRSWATINSRNSFLCLGCFNFPQREYKAVIQSLTSSYSTGQQWFKNICKWFPWTKKELIQLFRSRTVMAQMLPWFKPSSMRSVYFSFRGQDKWLCSLQMPDLSLMSTWIRSVLATLTRPGVVCACHVLRRRPTTSRKQKVWHQNLYDKCFCFFFKC